MNYSEIFTFIRVYPRSWNIARHPSFGDRNPWEMSCNNTVDSELVADFGKW